VLLLAALATATWAAQRRETLIYSRFDVDPGEWRYFEFPAKEPMARLEAEFRVESQGEGHGIRLRVLTDEAFARFRAGQPAQHIEGTGYRRRGRFAVNLEQGSYVLVAENRPEGDRRSRVELEANLITGPDPETLPVAYASPQRRMAVVGISLAAFAVILVWGGGALWRAARANRPPEPRQPLVWS
jgi:hypothetical protein